MSEVSEMESQISTVLRFGVFLCGLIILVGLGILGITGDFSCPTNVLDLNWIFFGDPFFAPSHIIFLGFFILITLPLLRIAANILIYIKNRDFIFAIINSIVLIILLSSILFKIG